MTSNYQNLNPNASVNSDEDDEFGGGKITVDKLHRNRKENSIQLQVSPKPVEDDDDDEFGGGKITVDKLRKKSDFSNLVLIPVIDTHTPPTDENEYITLVSTTYSVPQSLQISGTLTVRNSITQSSLVNPSLFRW